MKCAVLNCTNSHKPKDKKVGFFHFPKDEKLQRKWLHFCRRAANVKNERICSEHFLPDDLENYMKFEMGKDSIVSIKNKDFTEVISIGFAKYRELKPDAVPSVTIEGESIESVARSSRITQRTNKKIVAELLNVGTEVVDAMNVTCNELESSDVLSNVDAEEENDPVTMCDSEQLFTNQIAQLEANIKTLKRENFCLNQMQIKRNKEMSELQERLQRAEFELKNIVEKLATIFTSGQIKKLQSGLKRRNWCEEDISHSITLYSTSVKAYRLLMKKGFPLPSVRTLSRWTQKININPGIIEPVVKC